MARTIDDMIALLTDAKRRVPGTTPVVAWEDGQGVVADREWRGIELTFGDAEVVLELSELDEE